MTEEEKTRHKLRQAARFEVYAHLIGLSDMYRGQAESLWKDGELDRACRLRRRADDLRVAASDIRREFDIKRSVSDGPPS